ncbi:MAG: hypothetical protein HDT27_02300 [Subdoligranulum sp.]|nr:hypothetical protein [Subdoligranulum sp.]
MTEKRLPGKEFPGSFLFFRFFRILKNPNSVLYRRVDGFPKKCLSVPRHDALGTMASNWNPEKDVEN